MDGTGSPAADALGRHRVLAGRPHDRRGPDHPIAGQRGGVSPAAADAGCINRPYGLATTVPDAPGTTRALPRFLAGREAAALRPAGRHIRVGGADWPAHPPVPVRRRTRYIGGWRSSR